MDISDRIEKYKKDRERRVARIATDRAAVAKLDKDIKALEALEIQGLLHEYNIPASEVKAMIQKMAETASENEGGEDAT